MIGHALNQAATLWIGKPSPFGGYEWIERRVIRVRWQDKQQLVRDRQGVERVSSATVYSEVEVPFDARLAKGEHTIADPTDPDAAIESWTPMAREEMVDLSGRTVGWKVFL